MDAFEGIGAEDAVDRNLRDINDLIYFVLSNLPVH
jgi:hypothetical protein